MLKKLLLSALVLISFKGFSQFTTKIDILKKKASGTMDVNSSLIKRLKKENCQTDGVNMFHFYSMSLIIKQDKNDFLNGDFIDHLEFETARKNGLIARDCYPISQAIIYDHKDSLVAYAEEFNVICVGVGYHDIAESMNNFIQQKKLQFGFRLSGSNAMILFGLTEQDIYVLNLMSNQIYTMDEFISCCWNDLDFD